MALSTDIRLPKSQEPIFPDACVVCGAEHPNHSVKVGTNAIGWWTVATLWFGKRFAVRVPACPKCATKLRLRRWGALAVFCVLAVVTVFFIAPIITPHIPRGLQKWAVVGAALICLSPFVVWEILFPPAIELTAYTNEVDYEFRDKGYAMRFLLLNKQDWYEASPVDLDS